MPAVCEMLDIPYTGSDPLALAVGSTVSALNGLGGYVTIAASLAIIARLVDQSLVRSIVEPSGDSRLTMLETLREYGIELLDTMGERPALRQRRLRGCGVETQGQLQWRGAPARE